MFVRSVVRTRPIFFLRSHVGPRIFSRHRFSPSTRFPTTLEREHPEVAAAVSPRQSQTSTHEQSRQTNFHVHTREIPDASTLYTVFFCTRRAKVDRLVGFPLYLSQNQRGFTGWQGRQPNRVAARVAANRRALRTTTNVLPLVVRGTP